MDIIQLQIVILATILLSGILSGKKGSLIAGAVWLVTTLIMMYSNAFAAIQLITVAFSYQFSLIIGIGRDFYIKKRMAKLKK